MRVPLSEDTVEQITQGMYGVVNEGGTAGMLKMQGIEFCGKTGSAQVMSNTERGKIGKAASKGKNNAWFVGYAPRRNPEIVVSVLVEGGGTRRTSLPLRSPATSSRPTTTRRTKRPMAAS